MLEYKTIYADPPWNESGGGKIKRGADKHYELMKTKDIIAYMKNIPIAESAHLWLWVTNNFLPDGLKVIDALGFRYVTNTPWIKAKFHPTIIEKGWMIIKLQIGLGQYQRGCHESLLFAIKGKHMGYKTGSTSANRSKCTIPSVTFSESLIDLPLLTERNKHSKKPKVCYDRIEMISYPPYLEVFARQERDGWDAIGNEVEGNIKENQSSLDQHCSK